jgi:hypothetical protein
MGVRRVCGLRQFAKLTDALAIGGIAGTRQHESGGGSMSGGTDLLDILLYALAGAALIMVVGGGAFQSWRRWSDNRRIRKHLRK